MNIYIILCKRAILLLILLVLSGQAVFAIIPQHVSTPENDTHLRIAARDNLNESIEHYPHQGGKLSPNYRKRVEPNPSNDTMIVRGQITDEEGKYLEGAYIRIKGTSNGTATDSLGQFMITGAKPSEVLVISLIGYQSMEIHAREGSILKLKMKRSAQVLSEITISTGYQFIPKDRSAGSFDFIDNKALNIQTGTNIIDRIDGIANSVYFPKQTLLSGAPKFMIRGLSTINGPKDPLIVVDNFPYAGDINEINPNDVESITVLKDAAATSIWGTKAGNGVIVITTKKGRLNQDLRVGFNTGVVVTGKPDLYSLPIISSNSYINLERQLFDDGYYDYTLTDTYNYTAVSPVVEILNSERNGEITSETANTQIDRYRNIDIRNQYAKYMYQKAVTSQYDVSLQGGGKQISYYLSAGYDKGADELDNKTDRFTIRSNNTYIPVKNLRVTLDVQYTQIKTRTGKPAFLTDAIGYQWAIPYYQLADPSGAALPFARSYRTGYVDTAGAGKLLDWNYYPLNDWKHSYFTNNNQSLRANFGLNYEIIKGLTLDLKYLYGNQNRDQQYLEDIQSFDTRDQINRFSQIDWATGTVTRIVPLGGILQYSTTIDNIQSLRGQINFSHIWKKYAVNVIAGTEISQTLTNGKSDKVYGYDKDILSESDVDLINPYPDYINGGNRYISGGNSFSNSLARMVSLYANLGYTFDQKYMFNLSARKDGSNLFGVSAIDKWKPLWSAGTGWLVSEEPFYHSGIIPFLKVRLTYGFSGNVNPSTSAITTLRFSGSSQYTHYQQATITAFSNPDLGWEKVRMLNLGFDFQTTKNVITGSVEGYLKKGSDLIGPTPYDPTFGLNLSAEINKNIASMTGRGIDVKLNSENLRGEFKWGSSLNFSYVMQKTAEYYNNPNNLTLNYINDGTIVGPLKGKPLYSITAYQWGGLDSDGNPQGVLNKKISTNYDSLLYYTPLSDLVYKPALPTFFGALSNTFEWKRISLMVNITYQMGYYFMKPSFYYFTLFGAGAVIGSADYEKRWQKSGDEKTTNVPSMIYPDNSSRDLFYNSSTALIRRAGNIKLQFIHVGYEFNKSDSPSFPIKGLQLYFNASNLGMLWCANKEKIDPDYKNVPEPGKTFAIGLRADF